MAYTFDNICRMVSKFVPKNAMDDHQADICTIVWQKIWQKYDWKESLATLPPFYLIPNEQDIGAPFYSVPDDFAGLRKVDLVYLNSNPPIRTQLTVIKDLNLTNIRWAPHSICYNPDTSSFRVFNRTNENIGAPYYQIEGTYKTKPTVITPSTITTEIPTSDDYITMWIEGIKWAALYFAGNNLAGSVQFQNGEPIYTGQLANFHAEMMNCAMVSGLELGDNRIYPSEALATDFRGNNLSIFGERF